ncbi:hypothetical protein BDZ94DRAFT_1305132 [Collybia nuda]|uniref:Uncharacterized protein n=1 Tax=Collybia nuda TaxID=64659 RepID=A0A9P5YDW8_9AGAR|nr:hypothetical protein BDZ94DRAFT_1305132 [Collybia nuda]
MESLPERKDTIYIAYCEGGLPFFFMPLAFLHIGFLVHQLFHVPAFAHTSAHAYCLAHLPHT